MELLVYTMIIFITFASFIRVQSVSSVSVSSVSSDHDQNHDQNVYIVLTTKKPTTTTSQIEHNLAILNSLNTLNDDDHDDVVGAPMIKHHYSEALHGFSARMSTQQSESLHQLEDVIEVYEDTTYNLHTTHSPQFLGLNNPINLGHHTSTLQDQLYELSQNVIIGILDSGVWPESPSFIDDNMSLIPSRWKGRCDNSSDFNKKLIGARGFIKGSNASARDDDGHGTHTASTAAGALVPGANLFGYAPGIAQGMAPGARLATYKVCSKDGCKGSDVLAGIDAAVADGVDVLSISMGVLAANNTIDFIGLATFRAMERGIFVSCSAGNSGPTPSSVSNTAPWIMTVGAGTMDRDFPAYVTLQNGEKYTGVSLYSGKGMGKKPVELVYGTSNNSKLCFPNSLNSSAVKGKVVICDRGITPRMAKGIVVKAAGGVGMILVNTDKDGRQLFADSHLLPAVAVTYKDGAMIKKFAASKNGKVLLTFGRTVMNVRPAPQVTAFSSRGPNHVMPGILKPDVIGPGLNILAAWPEAIGPSGVEGDNRTTKFNIVSGTSMSCPHISGLAALLKAAHPDWSPSAIKSALMTTAYTLDNTGSPILDIADNSTATPWDLGAGHVDIVRAMSPGLVYNATPNDFIALICSYYKNNITIVRAISGTDTNCTKQLNDPGQLNYPSFSVVFGKYVGSLSYSRELTNVEDVHSTYNVCVEAPQIVEVKVNPLTLVFQKLGDTQHYNVTFTLKNNASAGSQDSTRFGSITWMNGKNRVKSPIAIFMQSD